MAPSGRPWVCVLEWGCLFVSPCRCCDESLTCPRCPIHPSPSIFCQRWKTDGWMRRRHGVCFYFDGKPSMSCAAAVHRCALDASCVDTAAQRERGRERGSDRPVCACVCVRVSLLRLHITLEIFALASSCLARCTPAGAASG